MPNKIKKNYYCSLPPFERFDVVSMMEVSKQAGWSMTAFDLPKAWELSQGEGVVIAVLDTGCDLSHEDLIPNLLEGKNFVTPNTPPEDDCGHGCVDGNTKIFLPKLGIKTIKEYYNSIESIESTNHMLENGFIKAVNNQQSIALNDKFETNIDEILYVHKTKIIGKVYEIELKNGEKFRLTPWHKVPVSCITKGRTLFCKLRADELAVGYSMLLPDYNGILAGDGVIINGTVVTSDLSYILGLILTDGHIGKDHVDFNSNTPELLLKFEAIVSKSGLASRVKYYKNRVLVYGNKFIEFVKAFGIIQGRKSYTQCLPNAVMNLDKISQCAFIAGVIDGDGCVCKKNQKNRIITASSQFADGISLLLRSKGYSTKVECVGKRGSSNEKCSDVYHVCFSRIQSDISNWITHPIKRDRSTIQSNHKRCGTRIKSIKEIEVDEYFYDLTMKNSHNYLANGYFVSNTHVTGTLVAINNHNVVGIAPKAKVRPVKVLNKKGDGNLKNVADAIRWCIEMKVDFISMSLGSPTPVQELRKAIQAAAAKGIITFCAAGNAGDTKDVFYPAAYPETIAIGAIDASMKRAGFSNTGKNLDFMAPGVDILSTVPKNWYAKLSGTSMAQPFACAVAALLLSYVRTHDTKMILETADDYRNKFEKYCTPVVNGNYSDSAFYSGFGIIDPRKFIEALGSGDPSYDKN